MAPKRVQVYIAPAIRNNIHVDGVPSLNPVDVVKKEMKNARINMPVVCGGRCDVYDFAVENLDDSQAKGLAKNIEKFDGYAAKVDEWVP